MYPKLLFKTPVQLVDLPPDTRDYMYQIAQTATTPAGYQICFDTDAHFAGLLKAARQKQHVELPSNSGFEST